MEDGWRTVEVDCRTVYVGQWKMAGGQCELFGEWWNSAGGQWKLSAQRCKLAGGRWILASENLPHPPLPPHQ